MFHKLVDVFVVQFNTPDKDISCFNSIINSPTYKPRNVTFYDNSYSNINLSELWNHFISNSQAEYICLLNNDTRVTGEWLTLMMETMLKDTKAGAVGPSTNNTGNPHQRQLPVNHLPKEVDFAQYSPNYQLDGFCLLIRKSAWADVQGFNPKYNFFGQESEFLFLLQQKGWKTIHRTDAFVYHDHHASILKTAMSVDTELQKAGKLYWETVKSHNKI